MSTLAIDFGGTRIKAGVVSCGEMKDSFILDTPKNSKLAQLLPLIKEAFLARPKNVIQDVKALVCALPALVDSPRCKVTRVFGKYDDSLDFPLELWAKEELDLPVLIENDARAAAIGEWQHGAGKGYDHLVTVTLGTGIGTAVISDGAPFRGSLGVAGNLGGHTIIKPNGRPCVCGMNGCIEAYVSTWALRDLAIESDLFSKSSLSTCSKMDYLNVFQHAAAGDKLAIELQQNALQYWSLLITNLTHLYDPQAIIIGGGIMAGKDEILPALSQMFHNQLNPMHQHVELLSASLGDDAALVGLDYLWRSAA